MAAFSVLHSIENAAISIEIPSFYLQEILQVKWWTLLFLVPFSIENAAISIEIRSTCEERLLIAALCSRACEFNAQVKILQ